MIESADGSTDSVDSTVFLREDPLSILIMRLRKLNMEIKPNIPKYYDLDRNLLHHKGWVFFPLCLIHFSGLEKGGDQLSFIVDKHQIALLKSNRPVSITTFFDTL